MKKINQALYQALEFYSNNSQFSYSFVANKFHVDRHSISNNLIFYQEGVILKGVKDKKDFYYCFTPEEHKAVSAYKELVQKTYPTFKKEYTGAPKRKECFIRWLKYIGKDVSLIVHPVEKYNYNRHIFDKIDTEEKAYWLGFIEADGCLTSENTLAINLAEKDKDHLQKFCSFLGMNDKDICRCIKKGFGGAYTRDNPVVYVIICSTEIVQALKNKGVEFRKSGKERPFICTTKELEKSYIRGLIDGDGYIRKTQYGCGLVGSFQICEYVKQYIHNNIINMDKIHLVQDGKIWKLRIAGKNKTKKILDYFYNNALVYLNRKYAIYQEMYCRD